MTSGNSHNPSATMATTSRPSRFNTFAMPNGTDKPPQPIGTSYQNPPWKQGIMGTESIWASSGVIGSFGKRDTAGSRAPGENAPTGSGALAASSEAESTWATRTPWSTNDSAQNRASGSTSPNRTRDMQSFGDLSVHQNFMSSRPVVGPGASFNANRNKPGVNLDASTGSFKYGAAAGDTGSDKENAGHYAALGRYDVIDSSLRNIQRDPRGRQDLMSYMSSGTHSNGSFPAKYDLDPMQHAAYDEPYGANQAAIMGAHRPSAQGSATFPAQPGGMRTTYSPEEELQERLRRNFNIGDGTDSAASPFQPQARPFQFNPGSMPWEAGAGAAAPFKVNGSNVPFFTPESHIETSLPGYPSGKRGSIADRGSPVSNLRSALASPRHLTDTPPAPVNSWSRPGSRDPRNSMESERRGSANAYMLQAQQLQQPGQPAFYPPQAFYQTGIPPYQAQAPMYDPYTQTQFRPPLPQFTGHALPLYPQQYLPQVAPLAPRQHKDQDVTNLAQSRLLNEYRSSNKSSKRYELKDIYNYVVEFSGDQQGSRFIQTKLESANSDEKDQVFREIEPNAVQLMKDLFGNYVIQKFFEHGNQVHKKILAGQMKNRMVDLSTQMYACRVVQKALEHVLVEQQAELVKELEHHTLSIMQNQNGNHVIQKIVELLPRQHIGFIYEAVRGHLKELSTQTYGCRVVQRMLEQGTEEDTVVMMDEIYASMTALITDQYGNYVVQHIITNGSPADQRRTIDAVMAQVVQFSKHKYASNIVEKCIVHGTAEDRTKISEILIRTGADGINPIHQLMKDQYGNYVIQKLVDTLQEPEKTNFVMKMKPQFNSLKKNNSGRQIAAIDKIISSVSHSEAGPDGAAASLQVDVSSAAPTPVLTMEPNTPQSSSPPSTNAGANDDIVDDTGAIVVKSQGSEPAEKGPEVRVDEA
ncbi:hypothetical protein RB597_006353 [Gaeumannomyces tritici]